MEKLIYFLALLSIVSCSKNNESSPPEFSIPFLKDTLSLDNGAYCIMETPLIYENKLILMVRNWDTKEAWINCYNKSTLDLLWTWKKAQEEFGLPVRGFGSISYIYKGILAVADNNLSYGIDVDTGETRWKDRAMETGGSAIFGHNEKIANLRSIEPKTHKAIIATNISEGNWSILYNFIKNDTLDVALGAPHPFSHRGIDYLAFVTTKWTSSAQTRISKLNLYNLTEDQVAWTSDTIPLYHPLSGTPGVQPKSEDGQILLGNDAIYSYNVEDGSLEWWKWYGNSFVVSNTLTAADGMVYGNNDSQFFVGLDVHSGEEIFNTTTGGSSSRILYHDGKCYISSMTVGSENRLMVIDGKTGSVLYDIKAPFREKNRDWIFERAITVDPETGLVYTADHRYLLIYDFVE